MCMARKEGLMTNLPACQKRPQGGAPTPASSPAPCNHPLQCGRGGGKPQGRYV